MLECFLKRDILTQLTHLAVHLDAYVSVFAGILQYLFMLTLFAAHYRSENLYACALLKREYAVYDLVYCLF